MKIPAPHLNIWWLDTEEVVVGGQIQIDHIQKRTFIQFCTDTFRDLFWPRDVESKNSQSVAETDCHNQKCGPLTPPPPSQKCQHRLHSCSIHYQIFFSPNIQKHLSVLQEPRTRPPLTQWSEPFWLDFSAGMHLKGYRSVLTEWLSHSRWKKAPFSLTLSESKRDADSSAEYREPDPLRSGKWVEFLANIQTQVVNKISLVKDFSSKPPKFCF